MNGTRWAPGRWSGGIGRGLLLGLLVLVGAISPTTVWADAGGTMVYQTVSGGPIYFVALPDGQPRYLTAGIDPALSPDGQWVAFTRWDGSQPGADGGLWVIASDGSGERQIVGGLHQPKSPAWSPDGEWLIVAVQQGGRLQPEYKCSHVLPDEPLQADPDGDYFRVVTDVDEDGVDVRYCYTLLPHPFWGLKTVNVADGTLQGLPHDLFSYAPAWDPVNDWHLLYGGERGLVSIDLNLGTDWITTEDGHDHTPAFSPDGSRIVVSYWQHDHWEIHLLNADGSGRIRLTDTPLRAIVEQHIQGRQVTAWNNAAPVWSPDGTQIAFLSDRNGAWQVWVMDSDGQNQRLLLPGVQLAYQGMDERMLSWR